MQNFFTRTTKTLIRLRGRVADLSIRSVHMLEAKFKSNCEVAVTRLLEEVQSHSRVSQKIGKL